MGYQLRIRHRTVTAVDLLERLDDLFEPEAGSAREADGSPALRIPFWQRDYEWTPDQIRPFLKAILKAADSRRCAYLGTVVLGVHARHWTQVLVIDGQQRLRTLQILINRCKGPLLRLARGIDISGRPLSDADIDQDLQEVEADWSKMQPEAFEAFSSDALKGIAAHPLKDWLERVWFRMIDVRLELEDRDDDDPFELVMSNLFSSLNRQGRALEDGGVIKAELLFKCRRLGREDLSLRLADAWETARMLQLAPSNLVSRELLKCAVLGDENDELEAFDYDHDAVRLQFYRYLLLVLAYAHQCAESHAKGKSPGELLQGGALLKMDCVKRLLETNDPDEVETFVAALERINQAFIDNRGFLLLSRRNRPEDRDDGESRKDWSPPLTKGRRRLLAFQGYVSAGLKDNWLEQPLLMQLLRGLILRGSSDDAALGEILSELEAQLFSKISGENGEPVAITARDCFLRRALFDDLENDLVHDAALAGCEAILQEASEQFDADSGEALLETFREDLSRMPPPDFPASTGAGEIDHWIALDRGIGREKSERNIYESLANKSHISRGLNQSLGNINILQKAGRLNASCWPSLLFLAAYSRCARKWDVSDNSQESQYVRDFLAPLEAFWAAVAERLNPKAACAQRGEP